MRDVSTAFESWLSGDELTDSVCLVEIGSTTPIRFAMEWHKTVRYDGRTFYPNSGGFSEVVASAKPDRSRPLMSIALRNIEDDPDDPIVSAGLALPWSRWVNENKPVGLPVVLYFVSASISGADPTAVIAELTWSISGWEYDERSGEITFNLTGPRDPKTLRTPSLPLGSTRCAFEYKKGGCASTSSKPSCPYTLAGCRERHADGQPLSFGPCFPFQSYPLTRL